jgi:F0F1-type ATP synthase assembly protein I
MNDEIKRVILADHLILIAQLILVVHTIGSSFNKSSGGSYAVIPVVYFLKNQLREQVSSKKTWKQIDLGNL